MAQMLAAASIWAIDAFFGLVARNDAECYKRELLGRSWRRDWAMRRCRPKNVFFGERKKIVDSMLWVCAPQLSVCLKVNMCTKNDLL